MLAKAHSATVVGVEAYPVEVEVYVGHGFTDSAVVVGLPDAAVKESRDRVKAALENSGFKYPDGRITINLAPADIRKEGPIFDLTIAIGLLSASKQIEASSFEYLIVGELALNGAVRPIKGVLPIALLARHTHRSLIVPKANAPEAAVVEGLKVYAIENLREVAEFIEGRKPLQPCKPTSLATDPDFSTDFAELDFADVKGQESVKRAVEIAVAGSHNALFIGPPGSGKSMIAKRIPTIMPPMTIEESLETTKVHSVVGILPVGRALVRQRPFRAPHHTISDIGLIGGGAHPAPGEVSLANNGVLFLDELPEFKRSALEVLRQPLEDFSVTITRAAGTLTFPARFMLIAAMNPTPTGSASDLKQGKTSSVAVQKYLNKISGPLLDRIDIHLEVSALKHDELIHGTQSESSATIRERVIAARNIQLERFKKHRKLWCNSQMGPKQLKAYVQLDDESKNLLKYAMDDLHLSARAYDRILKVARTIADLASSEPVTSSHISEAIGYRSLDRQMWG